MKHYSKLFYSPLALLAACCTLVILLIPTSTKASKYFSLFNFHILEIAAIICCPLMVLAIFTYRHTYLSVIFLFSLLILIIYSIYMGNGSREIAIFLFYLLIFVSGIFAGIKAFEVINLNALNKLYILSMFTTVSQLIWGKLFLVDKLIQYDSDILNRDLTQDLRISFFTLNFYFLLTIVVFAHQQYRRKTVKFILNVALLGVCIYYSGFRTLFVIYMVIVCFLTFRSATIASIVLIIFSLLTVYILSHGEGRYAISSFYLNLLSRNIPLVLELQDFNLLNVMLGKGIGATVEIPWFKNTAFEVENRYMDGLYQTIFIKTGLVGLLIFSYLHIRPLQNKANIRMRNLVLFTLISIGLTNSYLWQLAVPVYGIFWGYILGRNNKYAT